MILCFVNLLPSQVWLIIVPLHCVKGGETITISNIVRVVFLTQIFIIAGKNIPCVLYMDGRLIMYLLLPILDQK